MGFGHPRLDLTQQLQSYSKGLVSIIIPCFNCDRFIGLAVDSALAQSHNDIEVLVVDDGSTDGSRSVIAEYGDRVRPILLNHRGASVARNVGLAEAHGEFIQFLDADDLLLEDAVSRRLSAFHGDADGVFGDLEFFDNSSGHSIRISSHDRWPGSDPLAHLIENNFYTEAPLHRRRVLYQIGGFDEGLPCSQELDLHIRLFLAGARFYYLRGLVARARVHSAPDRIENASWFEDRPDLHVQIVEHHLRLISDHDRSLLSPQIRRAFAEKLWSRGVIAGRNGAFRVAQRYFRYAKGLDPGMKAKGSRTFRLFVALCGPTPTVWMLHRKRLLWRAFSSSLLSTL